MKTFKTNQELISELMRSNQGVLGEAFVITAISWYVEQVIATDPNKYDNSVISGEAWLTTAKEIKKILDQYFTKSA